MITAWLDFNFGAVLHFMATLIGFVTFQLLCVPSFSGLESLDPCSPPPNLPNSCLAENFSDVTFKLPDGSSVPGHRLILAIASPFFEAQFYGRFHSQL